LDPDPIPLFLLSITIDFLTALNAFVLVALLISSALISGTEVAFFSLSQTDLNQLSNEGKGENIIVKLL
jgi:CBS domain containing-hemolysin-like protein